MAAHDDEFWAFRFGLGPEGLMDLKRKAEQQAYEAYAATTRAIAEGRAGAQHAAAATGQAIDKLRQGVEAEKARIVRQALAPRGPAPMSERQWEVEAARAVVPRPAPVRAVAPAVREPAPPPKPRTKRDEALDNGAHWLLDEAAKAEGTGGADGYDLTFGRRLPPGFRKPTELTLDEWTALGKANHRRTDSTATGKYQFTADTLKDIRARMGLTGQEMATPELQDRMGRELLKMAGYDDFLAGKISGDEFRHRLAGRFASVPDPRKSELSRASQPLGTTTDRIVGLIGAAKAEADHLADVGQAPASTGWR